MPQMHWREPSAYASTHCSHTYARTCATQTHLHLQYYPPQHIHGLSCGSLGVMQQRYLLSPGRTAGLQQTPRFCSSTFAHLSCGNLLIHPFHCTCHNITCPYARTVCSPLLYMNLPQKWTRFSSHITSLVIFSSVFDYFLFIPHPLLKSLPLFLPKPENTRLPS